MPTTVVFGYPIETVVGVQNWRTGDLFSSSTNSYKVPPDDTQIGQPMPAEFIRSVTRKGGLASWSVTVPDEAGTDWKLLVYPTVTPNVETASVREISLGVSGTGGGGDEIIYFEVRDLLPVEDPFLLEPSRREDGNYETNTPIRIVQGEGTGGPGVRYGFDMEDFVGDGGSLSFMGDPFMEGITGVEPTKLGIDRTVAKLSLKAAVDAAVDASGGAVAFTVMTPSDGPIVVRAPLVVLSRDNPIPPPSIPSTP